MAQGMDVNKTPNFKTKTKTAHRTKLSSCQTAISTRVKSNHRSHHLLDPRQALNVVFISFTVKLKRIRTLQAINS